MVLWLEWWKWAARLRGACSRERTFYWMLVVLVGFAVREDMLGVSSFIRCLGLLPCCYDRLLDFFHSNALNAAELARIWTASVLTFHPGVFRVRGLPVLVGDGLKNPKEGRKMPGVKLLHQESESNTKPEYVMGHSCQAICLLVRGLAGAMALPLTAAIHEGVVFSNRDRRTLLDKMAAMAFGLGIESGFIFLADSYYASRKMIQPLLHRGCHLVSRLRSNSVAYLFAPPPVSGKRGRPKLYGGKIRLITLFDQPEEMTEAESPVYGEKGVRIRYRAVDLLWRPIGIAVRFVAVIHPVRGRCILMSTDLTMTAMEIIGLYGLRFKIEVSFKQALHTVGAYLYHFWMNTMTPLKRRDGDQHLHRKSDEYRKAVRRKLAAYQRFIQVGVVAQGIMVALATSAPTLVWNSFGSWLRTANTAKSPSEMVVAMALRNQLPEFFMAGGIAGKLVKFIRERMDFSRVSCRRKAA